VFLATRLHVPVAADDNKVPCVDSRPLSLESSPQQSTVSMWHRRAMTRQELVDFRLNVRHDDGSEPVSIWNR